MANDGERGAAHRSVVDDRRAVGVVRVHLGVGEPGAHAGQLGDAELALFEDAQQVAREVRVGLVELVDEQDAEDLAGSVDLARSRVSASGAAS
ncbi:hypothetical protein ACFVZD_36760 [Streptomyces sp. NPDC058287]|uniref:hypothetical protein n=1 Tax=Streptomyces sp. NPDC058287 TaxID=3346423 RepID=UPI0036EDDA1B